MKPNAITEKDIRLSLAGSELEYFYQPQVSFGAVSVCGAEALIRWRRADGQLIKPAEFIPLAEQSSLITEIVVGMLPRLLDDIATINRLCPDLSISLNATAQDFMSDELFDGILNAVQGEKIKPGQLIIELTETTGIHSAHDLAEKFDRLIELGVGIAMDDFGTGYSSLDLLTQLPFTCVKIDQGMVRRLDHSHKSVTAVEASVRMAHDMRLSVVAEGIETADDFGKLIRLGCEQAQGNWVSPPLPLAEFLDFALYSPRWGRAS